MGTWVFLSAVTAEFDDLKTKIDSALRRAECGVHTQRHFAHTGRDTLQKLDHYIQSSHVVIQLVGAQSGDLPSARDIAEYLSTQPASASFADWLGALAAPSYTQWEALLALHHQKRLLVYVDRSKTQQLQASQWRYLDWLHGVEQHADRFDTPEEFMQKLSGDILALRWSQHRPCASIRIQNVDFARVNQFYVSARPFTSGEPWEPQLTSLEHIHQWVARERDGRRFRLPTLQELTEARRSVEVSVEAQLREICIHQHQVCTVDGCGHIRPLNLLNESRRDLIGWRVVFDAERGMNRGTSGLRGGGR